MRLKSAYFEGKKTWNRKDMSPIFEVTGKSLQKATAKIGVCGKSDTKEPVKGKKNNNMVQSWYSDTVP